MILVVDTSVVLKWFRERNEQRLEEAKLLQDAFLAGRVTLVAPSLLILEVLNVAARKWKLSKAELEVVASGVEGLGIEFHEVPANELVYWIGEGLSAYDATFVALAQSRAMSVVSDDRRLAEIGRDLVVPLADVRTILP